MKWNPSGPQRLGGLMVGGCKTVPGQYDAQRSALTVCGTRVRMPVSGLKKRDGMSQCERRHEAQYLAESLALSYDLREAPHAAMGDARV